ncbi:hypothetical protein GCM10027029_18700 [Conyzicola lurida]
MLHIVRGTAFDPPFPSRLQTPNSAANDPFQEERDRCTDNGTYQDEDKFVHLERMADSAVAEAPLVHLPGE